MKQLKNYCIFLLLLVSIPLSAIEFNGKFTKQEKAELKSFILTKLKFHSDDTAVHKINIDNHGLEEYVVCGSVKNGPERFSKNIVVLKMSPSGVKISAKCRQTFKAGEIKIASFGDIDGNKTKDLLVLLLEEGFALARPFVIKGSKITPVSLPEKILILDDESEPIKIPVTYKEALCKYPELKDIDNDGKCELIVYTTNLPLFELIQYPKFNPYFSEVYVYQEGDFVFPGENKKFVKFYRKLILDYLKEIQILRKDYPFSFPKELFLAQIELNLAKCYLHINRPAQAQKHYLNCQKLLLKNFDEEYIDLQQILLEELENLFKNESHKQQ